MDVVGHPKIRNPWPCFWLGDGVPQWSPSGRSSIQEQLWQNSSALRWCPTRTSQSSVSRLSSTMRRSYMTYVFTVNALRHHLFADDMQCNVTDHWNMCMGWFHMSNAVLQSSVTSVLPMGCNWPKSSVEVRSVVISSPALLWRPDQGYRVNRTVITLSPVSPTATDETETQHSLSSPRILQWRACQESTLMS